MKKTIADGWHRIGSVAVYTEDGRIAQAAKDDFALPAAVYRREPPKSGWWNAMGCRYDTFRAGFKKGRYIVS